MLWKRYALVVGIGLMVANGYTFWPTLAYGNSPIGRTLVIGTLSYKVKGAAQIVGAPFYFEMQLVMPLGSTALETAIYRSDSDNLTRLFKDYPAIGSNPVTQDLYRIDGFSGLTNPVLANETGVTITFQNKTSESIHVADLLYSRKVDSSAPDASYEIGRARPLSFGRIQPSAVIINNGTALIVSTIACIVLRFYRWLPKTSSSKNSTRT